jgi:hypothetical protein
MSHRHQPSTSSKPASVFTSQCAALMSAVVLHAHAADQGAALSAVGCYGLGIADDTTALQPFHHAIEVTLVGTCVKAETLFRYIFSAIGKFCHHARRLPWMSLPSWSRRCRLQRWLLQACLSCSVDHSAGISIGNQTLIDVLSWPTFLLGAYLVCNFFCKKLL